MLLCALLAVLNQKWLRKSWDIHALPGDAMVTLWFKSRSVLTQFVLPMKPVFGYFLVL